VQSRVQETQLSVQAWMCVIVKVLSLTGERHASCRFDQPAPKYRHIISQRATRYCSLLLKRLSLHQACTGVWRLLSSPPVGTEPQFDNWDHLLWLSAIWNKNSVSIHVSRLRKHRYRHWPIQARKRRTSVVSPESVVLY